MSSDSALQRYILADEGSVPRGAVAWKTPCRQTTSSPNLLSPLRIAHKERTVVVERSEGKKIMGTKGQTWWSQIKQRSTEKTCRKQLCFPRTCNVFRQRSAVQQLALRSNIKEETRTPLEMIIATRLLHSSRSLFKLLIDSSCGRLCTRCTFPFRLLASFLKSYVRYR